MVARKKAKGKGRAAKKARVPRFVPSYAAGVLWRENDEILIVSRQPGYLTRLDKYAWGLPACVQAKDEQPFETAIRALYKETSIHCPYVCPLLTVPAAITGTVDFHVYVPGWPMPPSRSRVHEGKYRACFGSPERLLFFKAPHPKSVYHSNRYILRYVFGWNV